MARVDAPAMFAAGSSGAFGQHGLSLSGGAADATTSSHDIEREERPSGPGHTAAAELEAHALYRPEAAHEASLANAPISELAALTVAYSGQFVTNSRWAL